MIGRVIVLLGLAALLCVVGLPATSAPSPALDLKASLRRGKACGTLADSLPSFVVAEEIQPGHQTPVMVVCLKNRGNSAATLTLRVVELTTTDPICSRGEAQVDSCGNGQSGELQDVLRQQYASLPSCKDTVASFEVVDLTHLIDPPLGLGSLGGGQTRCLALRLTYPTTSDEAQIRAQTDSATWRYAFDLTG